MTQQGAHGEGGVRGWGVMAGGDGGYDGERVCLSVYGRSVRLLESHALGDPDSDRPLTVCLLSFISHLPRQSSAG